MSTCRQTTDTGASCTQPSKTGDCGRHRAADSAVAAATPSNAGGIAAADPFAGFSPFGSVGLSNDWADDEGVHPFPPEHAKAWHNFGFTPEVAHSWRRVGVPSPGQASAYERKAEAAGFQTAYEAGRWSPEEVMVSGKAVIARTQMATWARYGFTPEESSQWQAAGMGYAARRGPSTSRDWKRDGWAPHDAAAWLDANPRLYPAQASHLAHFGVTPASYEEGDEQFASAEYDRVMNREMDPGGVWERRAEWRAAGFDGDRASWFADVGVSPREALKWRDVGLQYAFREWRQERIGPTESGSWAKLVGERGAFTARDLRELGWSPEVAAQHMAGLDDHGRQAFLDRPFHVRDRDSSRV